MDEILLLIICATMLLPMIIVKAMQTPSNKPRRAQLSPEDHHEIREKASIVIMPFPTNKQQSKKQQSKKLCNNQRKWIQIGRVENEMKHIKARYKRFKEYSQNMPSEDIEISQKEISKELKRYKSHRKKLIRQALMSQGE